MKTSKIKSVSVVKNVTERYDIQVDDFSCYFANGILVHNTDGQNLMITWKDGQLRGARNKSHLKNAGAASLTKKQVADMFAGRGDIHDAFVFAVEDLENAIKKLSDKDKSDIFNEGRKFMNLEIIYPATENIIPYGLSMILFHGTIEYDETGSPIGEDKSSAGKLSKLIRSVNADIQKNFTIGDSPIIKLPKVADYSNQKKRFMSKLDKLRKEFNLKDTDKVTEYHKKWWENFILDQANKMKYAIPNDILVKLVNRWALGDKSGFRVTDVKKMIDDDKFRDWILKFDKQNHSKQMEKNVKPFELLFLDLGAQIMKNVSNLLVANPDDAIQKMRQGVEKVAKELEGSTDVKKIEKFKKQMENLKALGGYDAIAPSEGLVFTYNNKLYKLVGTFQPIHHIISLLKYA